MNKIILASVVVAASGALVYSQETVRQILHQPAIGPRLSESFLPCVLVPEGFVGILEGFRKYSGVLQSGINCVVPYYHRVTLVDKRIIQIDTPPQIVYSKDNQQLTVDCAFYYRINDPVKALYNVQNIEESLKQLFSRSIISIIGKAEAAQIIDSSREELASQVLETMNDYIHTSGDNFTNQDNKNTFSKGKEKERHAETVPLRMTKREGYQTLNYPLAPSSDRTQSPSGDGWGG
ncbi:SPFH domain-containing protein [Candidatus Odyssella thessalonicensis]|uniref:SPFH domain-containing protein n=1 Tax=Candidatus Odyssella thessalonicensis TaxID=84647 RepID=UPI000225A9BD|nr:SPFH domain-containing protein [Candidatus Odyssella thessalonicensis]